jgi:hypothetical protein
MEGRAIKTKSTGRANSPWCNRKLSRKRRRARLRWTAPPIFLLVTTPRRLARSGGREATLAIRHPQTNRSPSALARAKSLRCFKRLERGKPRRREGLPAMLVKPGSGVCVQRGGDCATWRGRFCWNCGSKSHAGVCAEFLTVDTGVSFHYVINVARFSFPGGSNHPLPRRIRDPECENIPTPGRVSIAQFLRTGKTRGQDDRIYGIKPGESRIFDKFVPHPGDRPAAETPLKPEIRKVKLPPVITALELKQRMDAQPFKPFRICMTDGKTYDITNHDMMFVKRNAVMIGINFDADSIAERLAECAIIHITRVEDIATTQAA